MGELFLSFLDIFVVVCFLDLHMIYYDSKYY